MKKMTVIEQKFKDLREKGEKAFIPFITAGDPSLKVTLKLILEMEKKGADLIELGIPFSDPMADGPTIQHSYERALKKHITIKDVLNLVKELREKSDIPLILFGYYNPIFQYGLNKFAKDLRLAGVNGVLVVDLPPEESLELKNPLKENDIDLIYLLTPTSDRSRIEQVKKMGSGFIYYVSVTGVTGARKFLPKNINKSVDNIRNITKMPVCVGFGISTEEQAKTFSKKSSGIVVGSAIITKINSIGKGRDLFSKVGSYVSKLKKAANSN